MDISLDFETLGLHQHACPLQIGLAYFNPETGEIIAAYKNNFEVSDALINYQCVIYPETLEWRKDKKSPEIYKVAQIDAILREVSGFMNRWKFERMWAKNPTFDVSILERLYLISNQNTPPSLPWRYNQIRDYNQLLETVRLLGCETGKPDVAHYPLADAIRQAKEISHMLNFIKDFKASGDDRLIRTEQTVQRGGI